MATRTLRGLLLEEKALKEKENVDSAHNSNFKWTLLLNIYMNE